jgi:predicted phosphodiesterase
MLYLLVVIAGLASCQNLYVRNAATNSTPEWVYLGQNSNSDYATAIAVTWFTKFSDNNYKPVVMYGTRPSHYTQTSHVGFTKTYDSEKGFHHTAIMINLQPNTKYYYSCGDVAKGMSTERMYITPAQDASEMIIIGDLGLYRGGSTVEKVYALVQKNLNQSRASMILHVGDISYADDFPGLMFESIFNSWFKSMQGIMDVAPYMVCPGNHDRGCKIFPCSSNNQRFKAYNTRFTMVPNVTLGHSMWYSFNYGPYHIASISTETDFKDAPYDETFGDQLTWLNEDLKKANANRKKHPWIIVMGHRPIYCSSILRSTDGYPINDAKHIQDAFEDIMYKNGVDIFMTGHVHGYERVHPVYRNNITSKDYSNVKGGIIHIINGAAGSIEGRSLKIGFHNHVPWSAGWYLDDFGYGVMSTKTNSTTLSLTWKFYSSSDNVIRDEFTVNKPNQF